MGRNRNFRWISFAVPALLLIAVHVEAQNAGGPQRNAQLVGTVLDEQGQPLRNISVHAVLELTGMYMPTANSDEAGHFAIQNLQPGTYSIFGESDAEAYPNTALPFYSNKNPVKATLGNFGAANVVLVLGPRAGVLCGTVLDRKTGTAVVSKHAVQFIVRKVADREDAIEFRGRSKFRWLLPPATEVTLEVLAEGYKPWIYSDPSSPSTPIPFRIDSGEQKILNVHLEPKSQPSNERE